MGLWVSSFYLHDIHRFFQQGLLLCFFASRHITFVHLPSFSRPFSVWCLNKHRPTKGHWHCIFVQSNWLETWYHAKISWAFWPGLWWIFWWCLWTLILNHHETMSKPPRVDHSHHFGGGQVGTRHSAQIRRTLGVNFPLNPGCFIKIRDPCNGLLQSHHITG